jgi:hypothetical protein
MSCPYTPSQNGVSERSNRTIMEAARSMLHSNNPPLWLWSESVKYVTYILNRVPSKGKLKTPFELFFLHHTQRVNHQIFFIKNFYSFLGQRKEEN